MLICTCINYIKNVGNAIGGAQTTVHKVTNWKNNLNIKYNNKSMSCAVPPAD